MRNLAMAFIALVVVGCSRVPPGLPPGIIASKGTYDSPSGRYVLTVTPGEQTLILYSIKDTKTGRVFQPKHNFSYVHRWAFYWEKGGRLWCYSGDIGTWVWVPDENGALTPQGLAPGSPYREQIPQPLADFQNRNY